MNCSFFGHRKIEVTDELKVQLISEIEKVILKGYDTFFFGGFGEFDDLAYRIVSDFKAKYPDLKRVYVVEDEKLLEERNRPKWLKQEVYEDIQYFYPSFDYWYKRIYYRNCNIIDNSDYIIFYCEDLSSSGAYKMLKYAKLKHKNYINLFENIKKKEEIK